jgi:hypothetical protein
LEVSCFVLEHWKSLAWCLSICNLGDYSEISCKYKGTELLLICGRNQYKIFVCLALFLFSYLSFRMCYLNYPLQNVFKSLKSQHNSTPSPFLCFSTFNWHQSSRLLLISLNSETVKIWAYLSEKHG